MIINKKLKKKNISTLYFLVGVFILLGGCLIFFIRPPQTFPIGSIITITEGSGLDKVAKILKEKHVIRSTFIFENYMIVTHHEHDLVAGEYYFDAPLNVFAVAKNISSGFYDLKPIRITIPEGYTISAIAKTIAKYLPHFNQKEFILKTQGKEGYLFPDTYFFLPNTNVDTIIKTLEDTFQKKLKILQPEIASSTRSLRDIITMASIIEAETATSSDRRIVSDILWKRIDNNMPLQVDATFVYVPEVINRNTFSFTKTDLKVDSPFNTYVYRGLPPHPIGNPGLDSLKAAIAPEPNDYFYYLSDKNGHMHYAKTFEEHLENQKKYLDVD